MSFNAQSRKQFFTLFLSFLFLLLAILSSYIKHFIFCLHLYMLLFVCAAFLEGSIIVVFVATSNKGKLFALEQSRSLYNIFVCVATVS